MSRKTTFNETFEAMNVRVAVFFRNLTDQAEKTAPRRLLTSLAEETEKRAEEVAGKWNESTDRETVNRAFSRTRGFLPFLMEGSEERYATTLESECGVIQLAILVKKACIVFLSEMETLAGSRGLRGRVREAIDCELEHIDHFFLLLVIGRADILTLPY